MIILTSHFGQYLFMSLHFLFKLHFFGTGCLSLGLGLGLGWLLLRLEL